MYFRVADTMYPISGQNGQNLYPFLDQNSYKKPYPLRRHINSLYMGVPPGGEGLQISSDGEDQMGEKNQPQKITRTSNKTQKIPGLKINPPKTPCQISEP